MIVFTFYIFIYFSSQSSILYVYFIYCFPVILKYNIHEGLDFAKLSNSISRNQDQFLAPDECSIYTFLENELVNDFLSDLRWLFILYHRYQGLPGVSYGKEPACNAGDLGLIPGSGRCPEEGNGYPFQYFFMENSMGRGARQATVHGSQTAMHNWVTGNFRDTMGLIK